MSQRPFRPKARVSGQVEDGRACVLLYGYAGPTPLEVKIVNDCIVDVQALPNLESEEYFEPAFKILKEIWTGLTVNDLKEYVPDAVNQYILEHSLYLNET